MLVVHGARIALLVALVAALFIAPLGDGGRLARWLLRRPGGRGADAVRGRAGGAARVRRLHLRRRHLAPNVSSTSLTATTQLVPTLILTEATVSFLRLTDAALPSWGETLSHGLSGRYASFPATYKPQGFTVGMLSTLWEKRWIATFTTLALAATVVAFAVFGDALRGVLDPRTEP
jgi:peptide/nickel transport system permease protein